MPTRPQVVFSSRGGARVHVWGGCNYATATLADPSTLFTYDVASDSWSSSQITVDTARCYAPYVPVDDGVLVVGGDTQPAVSGAGAIVRRGGVLPH